MSTISSELAELLKEFDYPAHQSDLIREARREGVRVADVNRLARMAPRNYSGRSDVMRELRRDRSQARLTWIQSALT
ncbi:hypothetical protein [Glaciihabitans sp. dw_435]|uniref:DUF2795 domain-containing protein n=1 Tax=Glaciihabitans sp. dw_435 TaxID=2720081 RepID=UPI001BD31652|nr:hypothetical protein [Glaciihabitans sp. dw_435]